VTFSHNPLLSICWALMTVGEWYLALLAIRAIRTRYPAFTLFISYSAFKSVALLFVSNHLGLVAYFYAYYGAGLLAAGLEMAVIVEVFAKLFRPYRYIPRRLLGILTFAAPVAVGIITEINMLVGHSHSDAALGTCRVMERCSNYAVLILFGALMCFSSYFAMQWRSRLVGISIGMFINSMSAVITSTLVTSMDRAATERLAFLPVLSFSACILIWIRYIRRPEELRAVVGIGEKHEIRTMLNEFSLCLEKTPTRRRIEEIPTEESTQ
jgi:hypothetical protein